MNLIIAILIIPALMFYPLLTALIAKTFGRKFWVWFVLGAIFPFVSLVILHCLPARKIKKSNTQNIQLFIKHGKYLKRSA